MEKGWCEHTKNLQNIIVSYPNINRPNSFNIPQEEILYCPHCGKERPTKKSLAQALYEIHSPVKAWDKEPEQIVRQYVWEAQRLTGMIKNGEVEGL